MRDESLNMLFSPVSTIRGIGEATARHLARLLPAATALDGRAQPLTRDLLFHLPVGLLDRSFTCPLAQAPEGVIATFIVTVESHQPPPPGRGRRRPYRVICVNETGSLTLVFFNPQEEYIKQSLPVGEQRIISGRTEWFDFRLQMTHPDVIAPLSKLEQVQRPEPVYPLTVGLTSRRIWKYVETALEKLPAQPEWIEPEFFAKQNWPDWKTALTAAHHPQTHADLSPEAPHRLRLAYDEMLAQQLELSILRRNMQKQTGHRIAAKSPLAEALTKQLPFTLTAGQQAVLNEMLHDMQSGLRMSRLLQGDVGSGKTIVALLAMLHAVEAGMQCALMVPTEMIAQQHYETISRLTQHLPVSTRLLTGSTKGKTRKETLAATAEGTAHIIIGTHALFQDQVSFARLGLVVIDEQHRFGVRQRMALLQKGDSPHLLHMSATPIPRTLTMMLYGDMDCSTLREKPAERLPITTRVIPLSRYREVLERLQAALDKGEKVYWICPLIEEKPPEGELNLTPEQDIAAAESRFTEFSTRFKGQVGLVHGRMKSAEREEHMRRFASGETRLLVATTVVEVGVDVRDATIIVIEKAERFGLAQLHQLRGRVGRGNKPSACVLLFSDASGETAKSRLSILRDSEDGFAIAEADLQIRGGGDLLGARQSGLPRFIFTDIMQHQPMLENASRDAHHILETDPELTTERGKALQRLLAIFG